MIWKIDILPTGRMRTDERNHYRQPDSPYDVRESERNNISKNWPTWNECFFSMLLTLVLIVGAEITDYQNWQARVKIWNKKNPFGKPQAEVDFACVYNL